MPPITSLLKMNLVILNENSQDILVDWHSYILFNPFNFHAMLVIESGECLVPRIFDSTFLPPL